jgi:oligopeptidase B
MLYYVENDPETLRSWRVRRYHPAEEGQGELVYQEDDTAFYTGFHARPRMTYNFIYLRSTVASEMHVCRPIQPTRRLRGVLSA